MVRPLSLTVLAALVGTGCARWPTTPLELVPCWPLCGQGSTDGGDAASNDAGTQPDAGSTMTWGQYTTTLTLPQCPAGRVLLVNTTADELDGPTTMSTVAEAGATLSFVEAAWISVNAAGPDTIAFDPLVFPPERPATITLPNTAPRLPLNLSEVCIDGRGRGVIVDWGGFTGACPGCVPSLNTGSLLVGMTLTGMPSKLYVGRSQVAGCRLSGGDTNVIDASPGAVVGPANVFDGFVGVRADMSSVEVRGNSFGFDPLLRLQLRTTLAVLAHGTMIFEDNVVWSTQSAIGGGRQLADPAMVIKNNFFGVDRSGTLVQTPGQTPMILAGGSFVFGPGNVVRGSLLIGQVADTSAVITRNTITGPRAPIEYLRGEPFGPPIIVSATATEVRGTCPVAGLVEVFSDPQNQAETFLGDVQCDTTTQWRFSGVVPTGRNVTATVTSGSRTSVVSAPLAVP